MKLKELIFLINKLVNQKCLAIKLEFLHWFKFLLKENDLIILDDLYPHPISTFRNIEFNEYYSYLKNIEIHSSGDALSSIHEKRSIKEIIESYRTHQIKTKIYNHHRPLKAKLLYSIFLCNIYGFLEVIERNKIPFVFTLYPGGEFFINDAISDEKLKRVFTSKYFKKVIVTQHITKQYLLSKKMCAENQIEYIFGVVSPNIENLNWEAKMRYPTTKKTLDICYVANKQMPHGYDKGYDIFIETIKTIKDYIPVAKYHVVGPYSEDDYNLSGVENLTFYGFLNRSQLSALYNEMDIIISPNRAFSLQKGAFDGFPTAACTEASAKGVAMFITDPLAQNFVYSNTNEVEIINLNSVDISNKIVEYASEPAKLYKLAYNGYLKTKHIYSYENQIIRRIQIIKNIIEQYD